MSTLDARSSAGAASLAGQAARFVAVGLANTLVTAAIFYGLSFALPAGVAYTIAFGLGVGFAVVVTPRFVFLARPPVRRRAAYAAWYLAVYAIGLVVVQVLDGVVKADHRDTVIVTTAVTAVLSFLGGRVLFGAEASRGDS